MISAVIERCAGIDVGKKFLAVCVMTGPAQEDAIAEVWKFGTMCAELVRVREWLKSEGCTHVAMESTGVYWKPVLNILEDDPLSDVFGLSGQLMLKAPVAGKSNAFDVAQLARGNARKKIADLTEALEGHQMRDAHRFLITRAMRHMAFLADEIEALDREIATRTGSSALSEPNQLLQTIPGIRKQAAAAVLAEGGPDMQQFPNASHFSSWSGVAQGKGNERLPCAAIPI